LEDERGADEADAPELLTRREMGSYRPGWSLCDALHGNQESFLALLLLALRATLTGPRAAGTT
jgi:hypothetical protein